MATAKLLHVDAIQTSPPGKMTAPGQARRIAAAALGPEVLQSRFQMVLYYDKAAGEGEGKEEESPLVVAAWIKESLSAALPEHPVLSGRLRRDGEGGGGWEVKFNDSGVRLVQATAEVTMSEFLASKDRDGMETKLAYWEDIDKEYPNFSALFYIQVTQFQGDGYAIGISCSLLLADPLFLTGFLKSWAQTHTQMVAQGKLTKSSMFHLSYFQRPGRPHRLKSIELESNPTNYSSATTTVLFTVDRNLNTRSYDAIVLACLQETITRFEPKTVLNFSVMISNHSGDIIVESCANTSSASSSNEVFDVAWWDQLGVEQMTLVGEKKPIHVSYQIVTHGLEGGLVVVMVPLDSESDQKLMISVTVPKN